MVGIGRIITVAGLHRNDLKARGATHVIDRHAVDALDQIRAITGDDLVYAIDTFNSDLGQELGVAALSNSKRGTLITLRRTNGDFDPARIGVKEAGYERRLVVVLRHKALGYDVSFIGDDLCVCIDYLREDYYLSYFLVLNRR